MKSNIEEEGLTSMMNIHLDKEPNSHSFKVPRNQEEEIDNHKYITEKNHKRIAKAKASKTYDIAL